MIKDILVTALLGIVTAVPAGLMTYGLIRLLLRRFGRGAQVARVLLALLGVGILYGFLRFGGIILLPEDSFCSSSWFGSSYQDCGFRWLYSCGTFAVGIAAALHNSKERSMTKE